MNNRFTDYPIKSILLCLVFFCIAAFLGLTLRSAFVIDLPEWYDYRNIQHTHSNLALLGWLFSIFYIIIVQVFHLKWHKYAKLFWGLQVSVLGMFFTFPIIGTSPPSIIFSSIHVILSYVFVFKVWRAISINEHGLLPVLFLRTSLIFLVTSTLGTWAIGPIIAMGLKGTALYYASIQFYLHFQFNGWFIFALIAIFFELLRSYNIILSINKGKQLFWTLTISTIMTFALAITWSTPRISIFLINSIGIILQLIALVLFFKLGFTKKILNKNFLNSYARKVLLISLFAISLKILIQTIVVFPAMAELSYSIRNLVIGFIHLLMLGGLSLFAFSIISEIFKRPLSPTGTVIFILGVISSELLLFGQGLLQWQGLGFLPGYFALLTLSSTLIVVGLFIITYNFWSFKQSLQQI